MPAPPALLDECLDVALVPLLNARGFDVVTLQTVGPRRIDDRLVLERAVELGRVLITQNTDDFKAVHAAFLRGFEDDVAGGDLRHDRAEAVRPASLPASSVAPTHSTARLAGSWQRAWT